MPQNAKPLLWFASCVALLGSGLYGYTLGVLNTSLSNICADLEIAVEGYGAAAVSAVLGGGVVGSLLAGVAADAVGPKTSLALNNLVFCLGSIVSALSPGGFVGLFSGRFITGIAAGAITLFTPRYIAETAPPAIRGAVGSLSQLAICIGILISSFAGWPYTTSAHPVWLGLDWWRVMLLVPVPAALLQGGLLVLCPESPVWLRWTGDHMAARHVERRLSRSDLVGLDEGVDGSGSQLLESGGVTVPTLPLGARHQATWGEILGWESPYYQLITLALGICLAQQLSGINTVIFYSSDVFKQAGLSSPIGGACLVGVVNIAGTILSTAVTDHYGRKPLMIISHAGMAVSLAAITALSWAPGISMQMTASYELAFVLAFVLAFSLGAGPIPFTYMAELLAASGPIKGKVAAVCTSLNWVANLGVGLSFPIMLSTLGIGGSYLVYALLNFGCTAFCIFLMIETKQQSLTFIRESLVRQRT
mmetsp:Transcript_739/g.2239  ORF Transcript_739/g.2239 Transcript_739/m.2239 type:complete len:477 (-) Transcript_739:334-1764(-)